MRIKYFLTLICLPVLTVNAYSATEAPFGSEIKSLVKNYNRATTMIATSGTIGEGGISELAEKGFLTIIDLRTKKEGTDIERQNVESAGVKYINIPVTKEGIYQEQLDTFTKAIEESKKPILLHCSSGNRAGALWATYRLSQGIDPEIAFEEGRTAGMKPALEKSVRSLCKMC